MIPDDRTLTEAGLAPRDPAAESRDVMLRLLLPDGSPAPQGGFVALDGSEERFPVGLEGSVYLRGIDETQPARLHWQEKVCRFTVRLPPGGGPVPNLGDVGCSFETGD